jgi:serine/threonine protein kinase
MPEAHGVKIEATGFIRLDRAGVDWQMRPELQAVLLGPNGVRLEEWQRAGKAHVVKHGPHRTVYRVALAGLSFYLKHYRVTHIGTRLKQLFRPPKARLEFQRAIEVAARNVATAAPLAMGERQVSPVARESFLITKTLENTEPISSFIRDTLFRFGPGRAVRLRQRLAAGLGEFVAHLHNRGITHRDLHADNILVALDPQDQPQLYLIDLHDVEVGEPLDWRASRDNLILLNRFFILRVDRPDRHRFWQAYLHARAIAGCADFGPQLAQPPETTNRLRQTMAREVETYTWHSNLAFWKHRDHRCLETNAYFYRIRCGAISGFAVRDLDRAIVEQWARDPETLLRAGNGNILLKNSPSSTVADIQISVNGVAKRVICKRFAVTSWTDPWLAVFRKPGALRSWIYGHGLRDRWLSTARPLAVLVRRRRGLPREWYLVTEKIDNAVDLHVFLKRVGELPRQTACLYLRSHIEKLARLARELHRRRISYRDFKAVNVLVSPEGIWLIDLVGMIPCQRISLTKRVQNLARLNASFVKCSQLSRSDRLRFLRVYMEWGIYGRLGWKDLWGRIDEATQEKVKRNKKTGRPLA